MTRDRATVDEIKRRLAAVGIVDLIERLRLAEGLVRQARGASIRCPWHAERSASCSVTIGPDGTIRVHCFGCERDTDAIGLVAVANGIDEGRDFRRALETAAGIVGVDLDGETVAKPIATTPRPVVPIVSSPRRPPDAAAVWARLLPAARDLELRRHLGARAIDAEDVTDRDLARAWPGALAAPSWARFRGDAPAARAWSDTGHRLILPMYDHTGALVTLHARRLAEGEGPKGLSPTGYSHAGAVFADPLGRLLLAGGDVSWWSHRTIIISEGAPDFLTIATYYSDADEDAPAVLGVISGSWSQAIADRIPDGCDVVIRTHADQAGEKYAHTIGASLAARCRLFRPAQPPIEAQS